MQSTGLPECPAARALDQVGEWWSILILRDACQGLTRFDEFRDSLGIAPNMLSRRLARLTEAGLLARRRYSVRPPRDEYVLTERGRDFFPVVAALFAWGNRYLTPEGEALYLADATTGRRLDPMLVDAATLQPITLTSTVLGASPLASAGMQDRLVTLRARRAEREGASR